MSRCIFMKIYSFSDGAALSLRSPNFQSLDISKTTFDTCWRLEYDKSVRETRGGAVYAIAPSLSINETCFLNCLADGGSAVWTQNTIQGQMSLSIAAGFHNSSNIFEIPNTTYSNLNLSDDTTSECLFLKDINPNYNPRQLITFSYFRDIKAKFLGLFHDTFTDCLFIRLELTQPQGPTKIKYMTRCSFDFGGEPKFNITLIITEPQPLIYSNFYTNFTNYLIYTENLPIPSFDFTQCNFLSLSNETTKQTITTTKKYQQITGNLLISDCVFKDIGEGSIDSAAIIVENSKYLHLSHTPYLSVNSCTFYNIFSPDTPAAIDATDFTGTVDITKICCMKCVGTQKSVFELGLYVNKSSFNISSLSTSPEQYYDTVNTGFGINGLYQTQNNVNGINFTQGNFILSTSYLSNTKLSFSNYENLSVKAPNSPRTLSGNYLYDFSNITVESCNFIWVTYGKTVQIDLYFMIFLPDFPFMTGTSYFNFTNCVFDHSTVPEHPEKYFHNCKYPTNINNISFETMTFSKKLMTKCKIPEDKHHVSPVLVVSIVIPLLFVLTVVVVFGVYFYYRRHQKVIEYRYELQKKLETDFG